MPGRLGVLHAPGAATDVRELIDLRSRAGVEVVLMFTEEVARAEAALVEVGRRFFPVRVVSDAGADVEGLDWVTTFADSQVELCDELGARLGVVAAVPGAWDKGVQRRLLVEAGLSGVRTATAVGPVDLEAAVAAVGLPAVVKPVRGAGGEGVSWVRGGDDVAEVLGQASVDPAQAWQVEGQIEALASHPCLPWLGSLVSVEVASDLAGRHVVQTVFAKTPVQEVRVTPTGAAYTIRACGDVHPAGLPAEVDAMARERVLAALEVLQVRGRLTHTELMLTVGGCEIVEVNGRVGGLLNRLTTRTAGVDLMAAAITAATGVEVAPRRHEAHEDHGVALGWFPSFGCLEGVVASEPAKADLLDLPGLGELRALARAGTSYADSDARLANLMLTAPDFAVMHDRFRALGERLETMFAADGGSASPWRPSTGAAAVRDNQEG